MMTAVDGRIDCAMTEQLPGVQEYYSTLDSLAAPSRVSGRVTAQLEIARPGTFEPQDAALGHESFSRNADADGYEIVIDTRGTLLWDEPDASERPLLIVTSERVSRDYLAYLGGLHISWIACGKERVDLARACEILASAFGVERMAVVGGGHINTALLAAVKHWHGAKADSWFSHIAVEVPGEDCRSEWCEPVSDEDIASSKTKAVCMHCIQTAFQASLSSRRRSGANKL